MMLTDRHRTRRIQGEIKHLGIAIAPSTVWSTPQGEGIDPAPRRAGLSWKGFLRCRPEGIIACDFVVVDTAFLGRFYALLFIEIATRRVALGGRDVQSKRLLVTQQARNLVARWDTIPFHLLIRDRDAKYVSAFDEISLTEGQESSAPRSRRREQMRSQRFVGTLRRERLDRILIFGPRPSRVRPARIPRAL